MNKRRIWATNLKRMGLTPERYEEMQEAQGGGCALCGGQSLTRNHKAGDDSRRRLAIDHDHACCPAEVWGQTRSCGSCIRGLLCDSCNQMIGKVEVIGLSKIIAYLGA